jgi:hypothetical protein
MASSLAPLLLLHALSLQFRAVIQKGSVRSAARENLCALLGLRRLRALRQDCRCLPFRGCGA